MESTTSSEVVSRRHGTYWEQPTLRGGGIGHGRCVCGRAPDNR